MSAWPWILGAGLLSVAIRLVPEVLLRGREPPALLRDALPWLPVAVAGTFVGILHFGAPGTLRIEYLVAGLVASLTWLARRSFYLPLVAGAATLALLRHLEAFG